MKPMKQKITNNYSLSIKYTLIKLFLIFILFFRFFNIQLESSCKPFFFIEYYLLFEINFFLFIEFFQNYAFFLISNGTIQINQNRKLK